MAMVVLGQSVEAKNLPGFNFIEVKINTGELILTFPSVLVARRLKIILVENDFPQVWCQC